MLGKDLQTIQLKVKKAENPWPGLAWSGGCWKAVLHLVSLLDEVWWGRGRWICHDAEMVPFSAPEIVGLCGISNVDAMVK